MSNSVAEIDYDAIRIDYDFGCTQNRYISDFLCDEKMIQALNDCVIPNGVINGMNLIEFDVKRATVFVQETGHVWILSLENQRMMLRRYTDQADTLRIYDCDIEKINLIKMPTIKDLAEWHNVRYHTLYSKATSGKWAQERRITRRDRYNNEREVRETLAKDEFRRRAKRHLEITGEIEDKGMEQLLAGGKVTNYDLLKSIAVSSKISKDLAELDKPDGSGNTTNYISMLVQGGWLSEAPKKKAESENKESPDVVDAEFKVLPDDNHTPESSE